MNISVTLDARAFEKSLGQFASQTKYILSKTINSTLTGAQSDMLQSVNDRFTIRRSAFVKRTFKMTKFATKADLVGTLAIADVGSRSTSDIFGKFESGRRKIAQGGRIAIPTAFIQPNKSKVITATKRPRNLAKSFKLTTRTGTTLILQTKGRGKKQRNEVAYVLKQSVHTPRILGFEDRTRTYINNHLSQNLVMWTDKALKTAKLK